MKTTKKWGKLLAVGMLGIALGFGLVAIGCKDDSGGGDGCSINPDVCNNSVDTWCGRNSCDGQYSDGWCDC